MSINAHRILEQIKNAGAKGAAKRLVNKAVQAAEAM